MNLSFSIKGWQNYQWEDICQMAKDLNFKGIELHDIKNSMLSAKGGPFDVHASAATVRDLVNQKLCIPCIDSVCDILDKDAFEENVAEISACIDTAKRLSVPYIRIHASGRAYEEAYLNGQPLPDMPENILDCQEMLECLELSIKKAEASGVVLLLETVGAFADTSKLRDVLNYFACDQLAALWDVHHPFTFCKENPDVTIANLGGYVKHVHIKDSYEENGKLIFCLIGEGSLPLDEIMLALRSINFNGFMSLEWDPAWLPEIDDMEMILSHYYNYMHKFEKPSGLMNSLYSNKAKTGEFIWKKELLIEKTFSQVLDDVVNTFPDQLAFKYTTLNYTRSYKEFRDDVDNCARALISLGVKPGYHVAVWATNLPQWFISFWAVTKIGGVFVSMNTAYKIHEAEYLLRQSDSYVLIACDGYRDSDYLDTIIRLCPELKDTKPGEPLHAQKLPFLRSVITVDCHLDGCLEWDEFMQRAPQVPVEEVYRMASEVNCHDVCNMQYTSGTTGFPKGVMLTHYNVVNNGKCIGDRMDLSTADRMMIQVPMFHCFGMVLSMTAAMTHASSIYPLPYFSTKPALSCIDREHITCFHGVPTMFIALLEHPDFDKTDFSHIRTGIMAGSPCPISVMQDVVNKMNMSEITIVFGQTESSPGCTMSSTDDPLEVRVATVGRALPEVECKIVDPETGEDLPDEATGEFVARGYNIMKGYYKMPKATAAAIDSEGWLHTGDLACRTPEGNYRITGRLKDMIIRGGENIYPKEIEEFIYTHEKVKDVQVIGVPDEQLGEEIMAVIVLKEGEEMTVEEMKAYILANMARHKVPKYIDFVDGFPMNAAGKILKYKMREDAIAKLNLQKAASIETA